MVENGQILTRNPKQHEASQASLAQLRSCRRYIGEHNDVVAAAAANMTSLAAAQQLPFSSGRISGLISPVCMTHQRRAADLPAASVFVVGWAKKASPLSELVVGGGSGGVIISGGATIQLWQCLPANDAELALNKFSRLGQLDAYQ